jgi:VWFA-related protein
MATQTTRLTRLKLVRVRSLRLGIATVVLSSLFLPLTAYAQKKGFDGIVQHLENKYGARRTRIPFIGVANFFIKIIRPAGVKSFKLAVFEDFNSRPAGGSFENELRSLMPKDWKPFVRVSSRAGNGEQVIIYVKPDGKDLQMMTVVLEPGEAVVMEVNLNPDGVSKFLNDPKVMGVSLAGDIRGSSRIDPFGGMVGGMRRGRDSDDNSKIGRRVESPGDPGYTLGGETKARTPVEAAERPALSKSREIESRTEAATSGEAEVPPNARTAENGRRDIPGPSPASSEAIRIDTQLVNLNVKALDRQGNPLLTLTRDDFIVYEDGIRQEVSHFHPVNAPINLVLLLDLSGSTRERREVMLNAAKHFIDSLAPKDRVAVAAFTKNYYIVSEFNADRSTIKQKLDTLKNVGGGTAVYDAMWTTLDLLSRVKESRKAIVVLTDGVDERLLGEGGSSRSFEEMMDRVAEEDITVYPIHLNPTLNDILKQLEDPELSEKSKTRLRERRLRPHAAALAQLEKLADESNGVIFRANEERDLEGVYQKVAEELRLLYSIAYSPENSSRDGSFRKIKVEVKRDNAVARTRRGYIAR